MATEDELEAKLDELDEEIAELGDDPERHARLVWCRQERARTLGRLQRFDESSTAFDEFLEEFGGDDDPDVAPTVDRGFYNRAWFRRRRRVDARAAEAVDQALKHYADVAPRTRPDLVAKTLQLHAFVLWQLDRVTEALQTYEAMVSRFGESEATPVRRALCRALAERARLARRSGRHNLALQAADEVIARFGDDDDDDAIRDAVLDAMWQRGVALSQLNREAESLQLWTEFYELVCSEPDPGRMALSRAVMVNKAYALSELNRVGEALAILDELLDSASPEEDSASLQEVTARVLRGKVEALGRAGRGGEIVGVADQAFRVLCASPEVSVRAELGPFVHTAVWWLLHEGFVNDAIAECERLLVLFQSEPDQQVVLADGEALCRCARSLVAPARDIRDGRRNAVRIGAALVAWLSRAVGSVNLVPATIGRRALARDIAIRRRKLAEAMRLYEAVIERLHTAADDDSQTLLVRASMYSVAALIDAGSFGQAFAAVGRVLNGGRVALEALERLARESHRSVGGRGEAAAYQVVRGLAASLMPGTTGGRPIFMEVVERYGTDRDSRLAVLMAKLHLIQSPRERLQRRRSNQR